MQCAHIVAWVWVDIFEVQKMHTCLMLQYWKMLTAIAFTKKNKNKLSVWSLELLLHLMLFSCSFVFVVLKQLLFCIKMLLDCILWSPLIKKKIIRLTLSFRLLLLISIKFISLHQLLHQNDTIFSQDKWSLAFKPENDYVFLLLEY